MLPSYARILHGNRNEPNTGFYNNTDKMSQKYGGKEGSHNKVYTANYKHVSVNVCKSKLDCLGMLM